MEAQNSQFLNSCAPNRLCSQVYRPNPLKIQILLALKLEQKRAALMAAKKGLKGLLKADTMDTKMVERRDERKAAGKGP